jgi:hypothetical protein
VVSFRIYVASGLGNAEEVRRAGDRIRALGGTVTYDWTVHGPVWGRGEAVLRETAGSEMAGVVSADAVLVLLPGGRGTHAELGAALGAGIPVVLRADASAWSAPDTCAFYHHELVVRAPGRSAEAAAEEAAAVALYRLSGRER